MDGEIDSVIFENVDDRQDYLSIDKKTAISAEGLILRVGETVYHDGTDNESATINEFSIDEESYDIIAHTNLGTARISFLYKTFDLESLLINYGWKPSRCVFNGSTIYKLNNFDLRIQPNGKVCITDNNLDADKLINISVFLGKIESKEQFDMIYNGIE